MPEPVRLIPGSCRHCGNHGLVEGTEYCQTCAPWARRVAALETKVARFQTALERIRDNDPRQTSWAGHELMAAPWMADRAAAALENKGDG